VVDHDAEVRPTSGHVRRPSAGDQHFGRATTIIDAGAAEAIALGDSHPLPGLDQLIRHRRASLPSADHNRVVVFHNSSFPEWTNAALWSGYPGTPFQFCESQVAALARSEKACYRSRHVEFHLSFLLSTSPSCCLMCCATMCCMCGFQAFPGRVTGVQGK